MEAKDFGESAFGGQHRHPAAAGHKKRKNISDYLPCESCAFLWLISL
jgi:hypothetical protein